MEYKEKEAYIGSIMNKGFERAANSFSKMINRSITFHISNEFPEIKETVFHLLEGNERVLVLTTKIKGDLVGASYLLLDEKDCNEIFKSVSLNERANIKLQEGLLLEIDNILSASVISQIADDLKLKIYGDVPQLDFVVAREVEQFIEGGITNEDSTFIVCNTTFKIDNQDHIHPQFVWKLSNKVFDLIHQTFKT